MKSIIVTTAMPPIISPVSIISSHAIHNAARVLFYYKGGRDIISIEVTTENSYRVYIPPFSVVDGQKATQLVKEQADNIAQDMEKFKITHSRPFLYDVGTKSILDVESFIDHIPYDIKRCLFLLQNEDGTFDIQVRFPMDTTPDGQLQFVMLTLAKRNLRYPRGEKWGVTGRQLLALLASERYLKPSKFDTEFGVWDNITIEFNRPAHIDPPMLDISKLNCTRALQLAQKEDTALHSDVYKDVDPVTASQDWKKGKVSLQDVLLMGLDNFFCAAYTETIQVDIDIQQDVYRAMIIDPVGGVCLIELQPGATITYDQIVSDLQSDNIQLVM